MRLRRQLDVVVAPPSRLRLALLLVFGRLNSFWSGYELPTSVCL